MGCVHSPRRNTYSQTFNGRRFKIGRFVYICDRHTARARVWECIYIYIGTYLETISICPHNINHLFLPLICVQQNHFYDVCILIDDYGCDLRIGFRTHLHDNNIILFLNLFGFGYLRRYIRGTYLKVYMRI